MKMYFTHPVFSFTEKWGDSMTFYERAFRYIGRKRSKSSLLFACFLVISTMVLCASMILQTAQATNRAIQEKTGTKLVLDDLRGENGVSPETIASISELTAVNKVNRSASNTAYPMDFSPVITKDGTENLNLSVTLHGYDNTEIDGFFAQEKYRLLDGKHITEEQNGVIVNSILAEANQLSIGDMISFETENGKTAEGKIIGIFFSGSERKQDENITAAYRLENQIFVDHGLFEKLYGTSGFSSVSVYTENPEQLNELYAQTEALIDNTVKITTSDALYQQMQAPLKQVIRITTLMLVLITITAVVVISLLLCMWTRTRIKETAVLISIGVSKLNLLLQELTESLTLFILSVLSASVISGLFGGQLMNRLFSASDFAGMAAAHLEIEHLLTLLLLGSGIVFVAVGISIFPILRANPRDTLSRMEG